MKQSKTGGNHSENQKIYLISLSLAISLYNKHIYYAKKGRYLYAQTMAHLHGGDTMWLKVYTTQLTAIFNRVIENSKE